MFGQPLETAVKQQTVSELPDSSEASRSSVVVSSAWMYNLDHFSQTEGDMLLGDVHLALCELLFTVFSFLCLFYWFFLHFCYHFSFFLFFFFWPLRPASDAFLKVASQTSLSNTDSAFYWSIEPDSRSNGDTAA